MRDAKIQPLHRQERASSLLALCNWSSSSTRLASASERCRIADHFSRVSSGHRVQELESKTLSGYVRWIGLAFFKTSLIRLGGVIIEYLREPYCGALQNTQSPGSIPDSRLLEPQLLATCFRRFADAERHILPRGIPVGPEHHRRAVLRQRLKFAEGRQGASRRPAGPRE